MISGTILPISATRDARLVAHLPQLQNVCSTLSSLPGQYRQPADKAYPFCGGRIGRIFDLSEAVPGRNRPPHAFSHSTASRVCIQHRGPVSSRLLVPSYLPSFKEGTHRPLLVFYHLPADLNFPKVHNSPLHGKKNDRN